MNTKSSSQTEIVYGVKAIGKVINEPNDRRVNYLLERGYLAGLESRPRLGADRSRF